MQPPWSRGCDWGRDRMPVVFYHSCFIFNDLELVKSSSSVYKRSCSGFEKTLLGTSVHLSLQDSIKPFCNPSEECVMHQLWAFSLAWRSALHFCSAFSSKLRVIPIYSTIKPQFLQNENFLFLSLFSQKTYAVRSALKGLTP